MPKPRVWRVARVRLRRWLRRLDRQPPDWLRWLTPWGTSLALHALLLLVLGLAVYANRDFLVGEPSGDPRIALAAQLRDDVTSTDESPLHRLRFGIVTNGVSPAKPPGKRCNWLPILPRPTRPLA